MFEWGLKYWFNGLWFVLGLLVLSLIFQKRHQVKMKKIFGEKKFLYLTSTVSFNRRKAHLILQTLVLLFIIISLARPLLGSKKTEIKQRGVEMIIAVDVSNSMLAEDDKPSRLEHAKHEILNLIDRLSGDRVGVIAFAGSAVLVSPMTSDHNALKMYITSLDTQTVSTQGTNFKDVILEAQRAFERGGVEGEGGVKPTRLLLVASDGEDNEPGGVAAAKKAVDQGIRVFALGYGSAKGAPIPMRDDRGNLTGY